MTPQLRAQELLKLYEQGIVIDSHTWAKLVKDLLMERLHD